jgi:hypothetical protein
MENKNIKNIVDKLLNEELKKTLSNLISYFGDDVVLGMEKNLNDDVISSLEKALSNKTNIVRVGSKYEPALALSGGSYVKMDKIKKALIAIEQGKLTPEQLVSKIPNSKLKDGTKVSSIFLPTKTQRIGKSFKQGFQTKQAGGLMFKWIKYEIWGKQLNKLSPEEKRTVKLWFLSGIGDTNSVIQIFKRNRITDSVLLSLANIGGQLSKKFLWWSAVITMTKFVIGLSIDLFDKEKKYDSVPEAVWDRFSKSTTFADLNLVVPAKLIYDTIIAPILLGGAFGDKQKFIDAFNNLGIKAGDKVQEVVNTVSKKGSENYRKSKVKSDIKKNIPPINKTTQKPTIDTNF